ncbi:switch 2-like [Eucalyptus grandis]|uniref:switch 2-like n=1 Tax=Eucalyptus grandis TaxID=71139 RepID=UPI00192EE00D|nr:switch 2-like [Eucalyptus grandis]
MEKRYFEGVQDCKEFQGELFGICNLFRDLSDKLFTSEIIELRGQQRLESETRLDAKHKSTEWGKSDVPQEEVSSTKIAENRKLYD